MLSDAHLVFSPCEKSREWRVQSTESRTPAGANFIRDLRDEARKSSKNGLFGHGIFGILAQDIVQSSRFKVIEMIGEGEGHAVVSVDEMIAFVPFQMGFDAALLQ